MIGMHYSNNLQTKSVLEGARFASSISSTSPTEPKCKKEGNFASNEHISMLDTVRRSPSPSTSTSTLSSSLGGGGNGGGGGGGGYGGSGDNTGSIVVGSENSTQQGTISVNEHSTTTVAGGGGGGGRKEEWVAELQPFSAGVVELGHLGPEKFNLGLEDWESLLTESAGHDQSLLRWISGDVVEDGSFGFKQLLQGGNPNGLEVNVGFEAIDQSSGFEALATGGSSASGNNNMLLGSLNSSALGLSASGFNLNSDNAKFGSVPNSLGFNNSINGNPQNPNFSASINNLLSLPPGLGFPQQQNQQHQLQFANIEQKPQNFNPQLMVNQLQHAQSAASLNFLNPLLCGTQQELPPAKRHNPGVMNPSAGSQIPKVSFVDHCDELLLRKQQQLPHMQQPQLGLGQQLNLLPLNHLQQKPLLVPKQEMVGGGGNQVAAHHQQQQQQVFYGQLCKATELLLAGNFSQAQGILARLNHQLSPSIKPFQRSAFYFKEALQLALLMPNAATSLTPRIPNPFDGMFKMCAYKALSEASPLIQFMNFTSNQALLEALDDAEHIHIIDFDIGFGAQWSSFMQELPRRNRGPPSSLKITAFSSPSTHHSIEISLMHENLTQFANDVGINFELEVVNFDTFDPKSYSVSSLRSSESEATAVNFPIWSISNHLPMLPSLLCFIKQLSPKIVVSMDRGCERIELPFSHHLLHALQYFEVLMDSVDAANMLSDTANKIERFIFQPKIESIVLGRLRSPDLMPPWRNLFASAGFSPMAFSNFAETQAECVIKRTHVRGFNVEKRQASLVLYWQRRELLSASAWRC